MAAFGNRYFEKMGDVDYENDDMRISSNYRVEVEEWQDINKELKKHGLPIVKILHPSDVTLLSGRTICMDLPMSQTVRENFISLMVDCDHRQNLLQDLILSNNQIKEDLTKQTDLMEKYHGRMKELKVLLESSRNRVEELEKDQDMKSSIFEEEEEKLKNTKKSMHQKCKFLQQKCDNQEKELERLKHKLGKMASEEEKRTERQNQIFQEFKKRTARAHNTMDEKLLDIIDAYEKQISSMQKELDFYKSDEVTDNRTYEEDSVHEAGVSSNMKSLIRSYEKQLSKANDKVKKLQDEKDLVKLEMGSRPEITDYRVIQQRVKKLEKLLAVHNISIPGENDKKDPFRQRKKYSTKLDDLEYLPLDLCRQYLRDVATELDTDDLENVTPRVQKFNERLETALQFEQFCRNVTEMVNEDDINTSKGRSKSPSRKKNNLSSKSLQLAMATIQSWKDDQDSLQELAISVNKLGDRVAPWLKIRLGSEPSVSKIITALDKLVYDDGISKDKDGKEHPSRSVLESIVKHFQTLFDVPSVSGVYPRMNDIYSKLGEVHNVLNTLRNLLGLDTDCKSSDIVDTVGRLCSQHNNTTSRQLKALLQTEDLEGVIRRLEEHNSFFPAFQEVMRKMFDILDVQRMDQVIPAVRALKLLAS
ncbi:centrosomal protein of 70 kDa-like isoform X1 [Mytilus trossulus]|uniref:centrosomal protein of 70 kDa-like isoform X1 n=1 Tax=Mytilus trossulus TaxID=6551 RepID=UPI00300728FC